jgi:hypothetical protein
MELLASQSIKLYMQTQVLIGNISYAPSPEARLLDALNGITDRGPVKRGRFLELTDVTIQHADGSKERLKTSYINKSAVQLAVSEGGVDSGRGLGSHDGPKSYPFVEKTSLPVRIETRDYIVTGNMYHIRYQKVWVVLEDTPTFLPITHAQILNISNGDIETIPFVAVNKEHILSLQEETWKSKTRGATRESSKKQSFKEIADKI